MILTDTQINFQTNKYEPPENNENNENIENNKIKDKYEIFDIDYLVKNIDIIKSKKYKIIKIISQSSIKINYLISDKFNIKYILKVKLKSFITKNELEI